MKEVGISAFARLANGYNLDLTKQIIHKGNKLMLFFKTTFFPCPLPPSLQLRSEFARRVLHYLDFVQMGENNIDQLQIIADFHFVTAMLASYRTQIIVICSLMREQGVSLKHLSCVSYL